MTASAQSEGKFLGGSGYFTVGASNLFPPNLESNLRRSDLIDEGEELSSLGFKLGGGGYFAIGGNLWVGANGFAMLYPNQPDSDVADIEYRLGSGFLDFGYLFDYSANALLLPFAGVGGARIKLDMTPQSMPTFASFGAAELPIDGEPIAFEMASVLYQLGLHGQYFFPGTKGGFALGIKAGYIGTFREEGWTVDGSDRAISGLETERLSGFFLELTLGGGGLK